MSGTRKKRQERGMASSHPYDTRDGLMLEAIQAVDGKVVDAAGAALSRGASLLGDGGSALGGLAKAGLKAAGSIRVDSAVEALGRAAGDVVSTAGDLAGPAAGAVVSAAGEVLSTAGDLAGPALEATGQVAGEVLGAITEGAGDILSS